MLQRTYFRTVAKWVNTILFSTLQCAELTFPFFEIKSVWIIQKTDYLWRRSKVMLYKFNYERFLDAACRNGFTSVDIAGILRISEKSYLMKLCSYEEFTMDEIRKLAETVLEISPEAIPEYFFCKAAWWVEKFQKIPGGLFIRTFPMMFKGLERE